MAKLTFTASPPEPAPVPVNSFKAALAARRAAPSLGEQAIAVSASLGGVPVFPCAADKRPIVAHWKEDASADPDAIRDLFARHGATLIGMPTGPASGYVVVDVDVKDGARGEEWLQANASRLPVTRTSRTRSGGCHFWFRNVPGARNSASRLGPGVDVRGDGGFVVIPPSEGYAWTKDCDAAQAPEWLADLLRPAEPAQRPAALSAQRPLALPGTDASPLAREALRRECDAITGAVDGTKHAAIVKGAYSVGGLVTAGEIEEGEAFAALQHAVNQILPYCRDKRAAQRTLERNFADGKAKPRDVAPPIVTIEGPSEADLAERDRQFGPMLRKLMGTRGAAPPAPVPADIMCPGGVLQMLVDECVASAIRPQPFLALGAAICAVGALAGRRYRGPTDLRTNVYIAAVAESGAGKDHPPEVMRRLFYAAGLDRYLGGENIASGRAVLSSIEQHPARLFQIDEMGMFLKSVTGKAAPSHKAEIWSELMKLYSRAKGTYGGTEYANQKENARVNLQQPHACLYGSTTPSTFWSALEGGAMLDGSLARFLVFVTDDNRPARNDDPHIMAPSPELIEALQEIAAGVPGHSHGGNLSDSMMATVPMTPYTVPIAPAAKQAHRRHLDEDEDAWALKVAGTPAAAIVNRLGENAAKLALIRAISYGPDDPTITTADVDWGWAVALHCTRTLLKDADRFIADSEFERKVNKALDIIRRHGPISAFAMFRKGLKLPERERDDVLRSLANSGMIVAIQSAPSETGGRPTIKYVVGE